MSAAEPLWLPLGELLVRHGLLSARQLELALIEQRRSGRKLGEVLVSFGFVSEQVLSATLLQQVGLTAEPEPEAVAEPAHAENGHNGHNGHHARDGAAAPEPPRRAGHLVEADDGARAVVVRVEELGHLGDRAARVAHLEAIVGDFERRSAEIQSRIAEVRDVLSELKT